MVEIRWHGRGGQGAKTAAQLLAEAAIDEGKFVQAFPEYGPERAGAPMRSFTRIDDKQINLHCGVTAPDYVVVIDPTLLDSVNVVEGLKEGGALFINTEAPIEEIKERYNIKGVKIYTIPATKISLETLKRDLPNTPMLGAFVGVTNIITLEKLKKHIKGKFLKKIGEKAVQANIEAIDRAIKEVKYYAS